ncbi:mannitol dehydrogenase family protein [Algicella marina]|uniref:Mannitol dehydrogenase family protein n=1 Tax=Algicella marina TaxID=2683284 RepID=A0A6P1SZJ8_9RHOB|nr:mannitol dehydrogenase family protein [Algicella marina]QHQ34793.1 mannitol dehydrogenase family protein [Algicella marina]
MEAGLPAELPRLSRTAPRAATGIVHLGLGAFFRAHGAVYLDEIMAAQGGDWGIVGVSLKSPGTRDRLAPQNCAYTALELGPEGRTPRVIDSVVEVLVAPEDPQAVLDVMAAEGTRIVTLTVTEKGYCHNPSSGSLNLEHPDIRHDLSAALPVSAPGYIVRALELRRAAGLRPFTVMTCDNLPNNGRVLRGVVLELARQIDPALGDWIAAEARFPSTMVDRIVPATKPEDIAALAELTGTNDQAPVMHEPFRQWVVEDEFVDDNRPDLAAVGVQMVADVTAFEHMKLRMLNGTHSSLAYLGYLAGHETIADTAADPVFADFVKHLWAAEIIPVLTPPPGEDLNAYADALFQRYANPAIRHLTWQIAMDGSQKLPQRILGTLAEAHAAGREAPGLTLAVAGWMRYVGGTDEKGGTIDVRDPLADRLHSLSSAAATPAEKVAALLSVREIFSAEMAEALQPSLTRSYETLVQKGARAAAAEVTP